MEFANKTGLVFDPLPDAVAVDATGAPVYTTPADQRPVLGDLARLRYQRARFRYTVRLNQASGAGAGTVKLTDGSNVLASESLDLSAAQRFTGAFDVDVSAVKGEAGLRLVLDVGTAADAGTTAEVAASLDVVHPVIVTAGC